MKISPITNDSIKQQENRKAEEKLRSDQFSRLLKHKEEANQLKSAKDKSDTDDNFQLSHPKNADCLNMNPAVSGVEIVPIALTAANGNAASASLSSTTSASQIQQLTNEIGYQIDVVKQRGMTEGINITFDSKTLEGLQVQIRPRDGEMAIRFFTQSGNISSLLSQHTEDLREALNSKGVKLSTIAISWRGTPSVRRNGYAGA